MKKDYQHQGLHINTEFQLNTTILRADTKAGDLTDLQSVMPAQFDKYVRQVDPFEPFRLMQAIVHTNVNWNEKLPNGENLSDPIKSVTITASYPNNANPSSSNLITRVMGDTYIPGSGEGSHPIRTSVPAIWTKDNSNELFYFRWMKMNNDLPDWKINEILYEKILEYDPDDPRVELSNNQSIFKIPSKDTSHSEVITPDQVGYVFIHFVMAQPLISDAISVTIKCTIGERQDNLAITKNNYKNVFWEIFSDKYMNTTSYTYEIDVTVVGPNFTDPPVIWSNTTPIQAFLPTGRLKYNYEVITIPTPPQDKIDTINRYIKESLIPPSG